MLHPHWKLIQEYCIHYGECDVYLVEDGNRSLLSNPRWLPNCHYEIVRKDTGSNEPT